MLKQSCAGINQVAHAEKHSISPVICLLVALLLICGHSAIARVSFHTEYLRIDLSPAGSIQSIYDLVHSKEYLAESQPCGLLSVRLFDGGTEQPTAVTFSEDNNLLTLTYGQTDITAVIRISQKKTHINFELVSIEPAEKVERILWGPYPTTIKETVGETVGVVRNNDYAIGIQALNVKTLGRASGRNFGSILQLHCRNRSLPRIDTVWGHENVKIPACKDYTMSGSKIALFGCPVEMALETIGKIELAEGLPHPMLDGQWAKVSPTATASYLIMDFAESNIDQALKCTKKAGLRYLYHQEPFETWGHFKLKSTLFPDGIESLRRCVEKAEKVNVRLGVHTLSNFITPNDAYVTPVPDKRLARTGSSTLTAAADEKAAEIAIAAPDCFNNTDRNWMHTVVIDDELIRYGSISEEPPWKLLNCNRGAFGTKAAAHTAGCDVGKLMDHPYKVFHSNLDMQHEIALNIADLFNKTCLKQISFDGLEGCFSSGHGDYARMLMVKQWFDNLEHTDIISDASNPGHFSWHIHTRMNWGEPWYGGFRESQQSYRLKNQKYFQRNFMPPMLGWFHMKETTSLDDVEWLLARAAGFDAGFALCTGLPVLQKNGAGDAILAAVNNWETARHAKAFSQQQRQRMQDPTAEFHLEPAGHRQWKLYPVYVSPALKHSKLDLQPGQPTSAQLKFNNPHGKQPLRFVLKVLSGDTAQNTVVSNPVFELDRSYRLAFDVTLKQNQYLVCDGTEQAKVYDNNWNLLKTVDADSAVPQVAEGKHTIEFDCGFSSDSSQGILLHFKTIGKPELIKDR